MTAVDTLIAGLRSQRLSNRPQPVVISIDDFVAALQSLGAAAPQGLVAQAGHPFALPWGGVQTSPATAQNGAIAMPVNLVAPMLLDSITFRSGDSSGVKGMEWRLYVDVGAGLLNEVPGANGSQAWTASAVSTQRANAVAPVLVPPGAFWLVTRVTSASVISFGQTTNSFATSVQNFGGQTKSLVAPLGATLDFATGWALMADIPATYLNGRVFGKATPWN